MLAAYRAQSPSWGMSAPTDLDKADRIVWGRALKNLRERSGKTLYAAATQVRKFGQAAHEAPKGISVQRWQQMEKGGVRFTTEQIARLTAALDSSPEELELQRARILGAQPRQQVSGVGEREQRGLIIPIWGRAELDHEGWKVKNAEHSEGGFDLKDLLAPSIGVTHLADDQMKGKGEPGDPVIFDRARRPKEGKGVVIETYTGELYPRLYVGTDEEHVLVRSMVSKSPIAFRREDVKGIYAVKFWGD